MRENLVIVRAGATSLHPGWLQRHEARNWDLVVCPFEELPKLQLEDVSIGDVMPGQKWTGLFRLLSEWDGWRRYRYVWLPDDDLFAIQAHLSLFFNLCAEHNVALAAPALAEHSFFSHIMSLRNRSFLRRRVTFVEVMMPCFRVDVLVRCLPTFGLTETGYGWGLDYVWPKLLDYRDVWLFDAISVVHGRPVGAIRDHSLVEQAWREHNSLLARYSTTGERRTLAGIREDGRCLEAGTVGFLLDYIQGYRYLFQNHPKFLADLASYEDFRWSEGERPANPST